MKILRNLDEEWNLQELQFHVMKRPAPTGPLQDPATQYQHYTPQFILRNFSHPYKVSVEKRSKRRGKYRYDKGMPSGDKVLNVVDLTSDEPRLLESPVSRWFGQDDMYKDFADVVKSKKEVEIELSKLEG